MTDEEVIENFKKIRKRQAEKNKRNVTGVYLSELELWLRLPVLRKVVDFYSTDLDGYCDR